ncbi:MAG TPA: 50S ribosomal protein L24 [Phycisphaerae bacterium]|nr:50S ribosomal protein L24 [Phycisphaerae bacterium]
MARHIRRDDVVEVISGDHKGERGKVLRVDPARDLVVVEGVNMVYRHVRPSRRNPQGGRLQKEAPIHLSNVLPYDAKAGRGSRVRFEVERDAEGRVTGKKRVCVRSGTVLNEVSRSERTG